MRRARSRELTLFAVPKAFTGHVAVIQRNAIESWRRLSPPVEIILIGDEAGVADEAARIGALHVPDVDLTERGTPLVSSVFAVAERAARTPLLCYVNADIVFAADLPRRLSRVRLRRYVVAGRRLDVDVDGPLDLDRPGWANRLRRGGRLVPPWGSDYFVFHAAMLGELPPFAVGRPGWDNWLIYRTRELGLAFVDATRAVTAFHQMHGYEHVPGGNGTDYEGPEADENKALADRLGRGDMRDATHVLTALGVLPALGREYRERRAWLRQCEAEKAR